MQRHFPQWKMKQDRDTLQLSRWNKLAAELASHCAGSTARAKSNWLLQMGQNLQRITCGDSEPRRSKRTALKPRCGEWHLGVTQLPCVAEPQKQWFPTGCHKKVPRTPELGFPSKMNYLHDVGLFGVPNMFRPKAVYDVLPATVTRGVLHPNFE